MKEVIDRAERFDRLTSQSGWNDVYAFTVSHINAEIEEATRHKYDSEKLGAHALCWNAKRELFDAVLGYIDSTRAERDRIIEEYKGRNDGGEPAN